MYKSNGEHFASYFTDFYFNARREARRHAERKEYMYRRYSRVTFRSNDSREKSEGSWKGRNARARARVIFRDGGQNKSSVDERFIFSMFAFAEQSKAEACARPPRCLCTTYSTRVLPINSSSPPIPGLYLPLILVGCARNVSDDDEDREITRRRWRRDVPGIHSAINSNGPAAMWLFSWRFDSNRTHC